MTNEEFINVLLQEAVINAVKIYGIEGTEEKIKELYWFNEKLKNNLLKQLRVIYYKDKT